MWSEGNLKIRRLLCFLLAFTTVCSGYVITTPKRWTSGEVSQVCVILGAPATPDDKITFQMTKYPIFGLELVLIQPTEILVPIGLKSVCKEIALPTTEEQEGEFTVRGSLEGRTFNFKKDVTIASDVVRTFIQTDKHLYKPSQTVQFRILTVSGPFLKVSTEKYDEIWIESPSGTRLAQWLNVSNDAGLIHQSFQLSDEPQEGAYEIKVVSASGNTYKHSFKVEEYVLPRFEVTIKPPKYVLGTTKEIIFKVCATYTFGQPVKGNVTISVHSNIREVNVTAKRDGQISGCESFTFNSDELSINTDNYRANKLRANASVTEEGTGVELKATEVSVGISRRGLTFEDISVQKFYKPELPYVGEVKVTFPDSSPAPSEPMTVCAKEKCKNLTTNANGILKFAVPPHLNDRIRIVAPGYPAISANGSGRSVMHASSFSKSIMKYHSPSNSSLVVYLVDDELECETTNETINFDLPVMFAVNQQESASVTVQVISRGQIQFTKTFDQAFSAGSTVSVPESIFIEPVREPSTPNLVRGQFSVAITLPKTVSPEAQVLIFYARDDGEVVSDARDISITECLLYSVNVAWSTQKAQPGDSASVTISAEPMSLCSLGVVDKSVQLLSSKKNSLTVKSLLDLAQKASVAPYEDKLVDDYQYCRSRELEEPGFLTATRRKREAVPSGSASESLSRSKRSYYLFPFYSDDVDARHMFDETGVYIFSDLTLDTRHCKIRYILDRYPEDPGSPVPFSSVPSSGGSGAASEHDAPSTSGGADDENESEDTRTYFPETWIWGLYEASGDGVSEEALVLPDTVTEWVGSAVCVHPSKGVGISPAASIVTFKEFFIDLTLPPSVKRGEIFPVKISVFNYLETPLPIRITLESPGGQFSILANSGEERGTGERTACVPPKDKVVLPIRIRADDIGDVNISVSVVVEENAISECGEGATEQKTDSLIKPIRVNYEGFRKEEAQSSYVCTKDLSASEDILHTWIVTAPTLIVPDSARGFVAVVGDLMGPTLENLGSLVRMPTGCGEQNMLNFAPNIFVMQYLDASNQNTPKIANNAIRFMEQGYQRELKYRHKDGSYSAFGESDDSGSTWLTAFVLKNFAQARPYISIDPNDLTISRDWLKARQLENGCFESVGKVLHNGMKGGIRDSGSPSLLSAFVLIALLEAGESTSSTAVREALFCLSASEATNNPYNIAVKAYALSLANSSDTQATIQQLLNRAISTDRTMYWNLPNQHESSKGVGIETASYAVLALLTFAHSTATDYLPQVRQIAKWINGQRNGQGGFISTQDTIIALQALAAFEKTLSQEPLDLTVIVTMGNVEESIFVNQHNKLLQQTVPFPAVPTSITLDIVGNGCVLLQSILRYNVPEPEINEALSLSVQSTTEPDKRCKTKRIKVCAAYLVPGQKSNMAIIEIDLVSGYIPEKTDLKEIVGYQGGWYKRYEVDGSKVTIYVDAFSPGLACLSFKILREVDVENPKPGTVKVYDYYKPEYEVSEKYTLPPPTECADVDVFSTFEGEFINSV